MDAIGTLVHLLIVLVAAILAYDVGFRHGRNAEAMRQLNEERKRG